MDQSIKNKVLVITGGANGIGFNIAGKYLSEGAKTVILLDKDAEQGNAAVEALNSSYGDGKATFMYCDVTTNLETVGENILASHKTIDVLINSAGIADENVPKKTLDINITALVLWNLKFYEHMRIDKGGSGGTIINISSIFGYRIAPFAPTYCASKFAVLAFTKSLGHEDNYKISGVRILALCPGFTETKMTKPLLESKDDFPEETINAVMSFSWQTVDTVGDGAVKVFRSANTGTAWLIESGQPIKEVP